ncbi:MAG TPA: epoxide hydrolase, partial [Acidimicrobiia bacterium]|nr:epoxide hydrolase [Acidimicrobiia bacterium]
MSGRELTIEPFRAEVADAVLVDLRERIARTRLPNQVAGAGWDQGTELGYLQELLAYWRDTFDWRAVEARLNAAGQFVTEVEGQPIHFLHVRSPEPDALPLVVSHGWPGSVVEFLDVIGPLTDPRAHGGDPADAFHVVAPSLPGYGYSGPTSEPGWTTRRMAGAFARIMAELGYERYGAQGGDWGSLVSANLADLDAAHVCGLHLNFVVTRVRRDEIASLTPEEQANL